MTRPDLFAGDVAEHYDADCAAVSTPDVLGPTVDLLADLAGSGPVLEFAIGTGRVALPLRERVEVHGIEYSADMLAQLRSKAGADRIRAYEGDMATLRVPGEFSLVYLVFNTIGNLTTQDDQVACFANAAAHLAPGGRFLVEVGVPELQRLPYGERYVPFDVSEGHLGFDEYDLVEQGLISHHVTFDADGTTRRGSPAFRYVWPSELDLMARLAGLTREHRWAGFDTSPFTATSRQHVSVWRKIPAR
ncbi:class I SAM-dependent methyltransferase [Jatrophihabitans sp. YIM 134969]